jgi:aspartyl aminopeptidase
MTEMTNKMEGMQFAQDFITFMNESCTAFHAVDACTTRLKAKGFTEISEKESWQETIRPGGKYFFTRNGSSVIGFTVGDEFDVTKGMFTAVGAHTDSPCLRIKAVSSFVKGKYLVLNTEPYGGGLWHTWFDRDLGLAGRAILKGANGSIESKLFRIDEPIARIPNLAIHLTAGKERESFAPNLQENGKAIISLDPEFVNLKPDEGYETEISSRIHPALLRMIAKSMGVAADTIEDVEMQLIDVQPSCLGGACNEFLYSGRLDNLCSAYQSLRALVDSTTAGKRNVKIAMLFDHEEVGSSSCAGAGSSLFMDSLKRIFDVLVSKQEGVSTSGSSLFMQSLRNSFVVSIDMAHALHPNYSSKHDATMAPNINGGLVIKHNANQRYATNSVSATLFRRLGKIAQVPVQEFSVRSDSGCGSTIGPIIATLSGILTIDVGTPQFSMHSIREMMGAHDVHTGYLHLLATYDHHQDVSVNIH